MSRFEIFEHEFTVDSYDVSTVDIPLKEKMHLAFGDITTRPSGVVRIEGGSDEGMLANGLGEGVTLPEPVFTDDSGMNISTNARTIIEEAVISHSGKSCEQILRAVRDYRFLDNGKYPTARLAVEMAVIDSFLQSRDIALSEVLGTAAIDEVPYGKSIGGFTTNEIISQSEQSIANNARKIKLKVTPKNFNEVTTALTELHRQHQGLDLMVDANGGFDVENKEHLSMLKELDHQGLLMIEEPVSRIGRVRGIEAVKKLRDSWAFETPICLDDCLSDAETCLRAVNDGLAEVINIKPGRIGSFMLSLNLIDYCAEEGKQVMIGGMFEATPGRALTVALGGYCLSKGFSIPGDLSLAQERLDGDIVEQRFQLRLGPKGGIVLPKGKGLGYRE